jgi:hypothetical protein
MGVEAALKRRNAVGLEEELEGGYLSRGEARLCWIEALGVRS